jgi:hypothetical protein
VFALLLLRLLERAGTSEGGSITGLYTVLVDGGDMNEPIADAPRSRRNSASTATQQTSRHTKHPAHPPSALGLNIEADTQVERCRRGWVPSGSGARRPGASSVQMPRKPALAGRPPRSGWSWGAEKRDPSLLM